MTEQASILSIHIVIQNLSGISSRLQTNQFYVPQNLSPTSNKIPEQDVDCHCFGLQQN